MYKHAGVAITVTTLTDVLAFGISASSNYISVRTFCIYTGNYNQVLFYLYGGPNSYIINVHIIIVAVYQPQL